MRFLRRARQTSGRDSEGLQAPDGSGDGGTGTSLSRWASRRAVIFRSRDRRTQKWPVRWRLGRRAAESKVCYLVGTPRGRMGKMEQNWLDLAWQEVRDSVEVELAGEDGKLSVLVKSEGRQAMEIAMRQSCRSRDPRLRRMGSATSAAGRAFGFLAVDPPAARQPVTRETGCATGIIFRGLIWWTKIRPCCGSRSMQLTPGEAAFQSMKIDLGIRSSYHLREHRVEAQSVVAFLRY